LHGANEFDDVYDELHEYMKGGGFSRKVTGDEKTCDLPSAFYVSSNMHPDIERATEVKS
jgi:hypothetical protein